MKLEKGTSILEVIVALALLGIIGVLFLGSAVNSTNARYTADERASAKILAESIIDTVKKMEYASAYEITIPDEFTGYTADITVDNMANSNIQKVTVVIEHRDRDVLTLENYKVN
ncbi:MAG: hypothetical protein A2Y89_02435, partial [Chloroflexi bacterium RBG_13_51_18]